MADIDTIDLITITNILEESGTDGLLELVRAACDELSSKEQAEYTRKWVEKVQEVVP